MTNKHDENNDKSIISEATPIRIGLIIVLIGVIVSATWWAASINSKLDSIIAFQNVQSTSITELKTKSVDFDKELSDQKLDMALIKVSIKNLQDKVQENNLLKSSISK